MKIASDGTIWRRNAYFAPFPDNDIISRHMADMHKINRVEVRNLQMEDYGQLAQSFTRVYADKDVFWTREQIHKLIDIFPEGRSSRSSASGSWAAPSRSSSITTWSRATTPTQRSPATRPSRPTTPRATSSTASRYSSIPTTAACAWPDACTTTARSSARSSTSRRSCSAAASPTTTSTPTGCVPRSTSTASARARSTTRC